MTILVTANATATAGREGHVSTDDKKIDLDLSPPGSNGPGANPEQLFASGYAACFGQAVKAMAAKEGLKPDSVTINAGVDLNKIDDAFSLTVRLDAELPGVSQADAEKLVTLAHQICPYSHATRGNIDVALQANGSALKAAA